MTATLDAGPRGRHRWQRVKAPTLLAGGVLAASVLLHLRDPHEGGSYGFCPWLVLTGTSCPGCGGLRAVNDLTRGDLAAAASSNLLFVGSIPLLVALWLRWVRDRWLDVQRVSSSRRVMLWVAVFSLLALAFTVVRNTPWGSWLAP